MINYIPYPAMGKIHEIMSTTKATAVLRGRIVEVTLINTPTIAVGDVVYLEWLPSSTEWIVIGCESGVPALNPLPNLWIGYHNGDGELVERVRRLDSDTGADLGWAGDPIGGFEDTAGEFITFQKCRPGSTGYHLLVATKDNAGDIRLYRIVEGGVPEVVWSHAPFTGNGAPLYVISSIWITNDGTSYFTLGQHHGGVVGDIDDAALGVYRSDDNGATFSRVGHGRFPGFTPPAPDMSGSGMYQIIVDEDFDRCWTIHSTHTGLWPGQQFSFSDDFGVTWANVSTGLDDNQLTLMSLQAFPPWGPFSLLRGSCHTLLPGDSLATFFCVNPRATSPTFYFQGRSLDNFLSSHGGYLYSDDQVLIRPRTDEDDGNGWFSDDGGFNKTNPGTDWWVSEDAVLRAGCYDAHERLHWFVATPEATGGAVNLIRLTVNKGVSWTNLALDGAAFGVCFFRPRPVIIIGG